MYIPGLIAVEPTQTQLIEQLSRMVGTSFLEEAWYATWLEALDSLGSSIERKRAITQAAIKIDYQLTAPFRCCFTLEDHAGAANIFLQSEMGEDRWNTIDKHSENAKDALLSEDEKRVLVPRAEQMAAISGTNWMFDYAKVEEDFLYFISVGVDPEQRGSGAFGRLFRPILAYADRRGINCYLDCYTERLQQIYQHYGFEILEIKSTPSFTLTQCCMVRRPR